MSQEVGRRSQVEANVVANFAGHLWTAVIGLLCVPLYVKFMGVESYGLFSLCSAIMGLLLILDFGLSTAAIRETATLSAVPGQDEEIRSFFRTLECIYWLVAVVIAVSVVLASPWIAFHWISPDKLSREDVHQALLLLGVSAACRWPSRLYGGVLQGRQEQVLLNWIVGISATIRSLGSVLILWLVSPTIQAFLLCQIAGDIVETLSTKIALGRVLPKSAGSRGVRQKIPGTGGAFHRGGGWYGRLLYHPYPDGQTHPEPTCHPGNPRLLFARVGGGRSLTQIGCTYRDSGFSEICRACVSKRYRAAEENVSSTITTCFGVKHSRVPGNGFIFARAVAALDREHYHSAGRSHGVDYPGPRYRNARIVGRFRFITICRGMDLVNLHPDVFIGGIGCTADGFIDDTLRGHRHGPCVARHPYVLFSYHYTYYAQAGIGGRTTALVHSRRGPAGRCRGGSRTLSHGLRSLFSGHGCLSWPDSWLYLRRRWFVRFWQLRRSGKRHSGICRQSCDACAEAPVRHSPEFHVCSCSACLFI